jgi:Sap, sulfolipid-1-addressing protein
MLKLALAVVAIALPDDINPSLIGGQLLVAAGPHPRRRTAAFTLAAWITTFLFGLAFALGLGDLILSLVPHPGPTVKYALISGAGAVLLAGGILVWMRARSLAGRDPASAQRRMSGAAVVMGAGIAGLELLTAFPYFAALAMIIGSGVSPPEKVTLIVLYCVVYVLPLIGVAATFAIMGDRAEAVVRPIGDWMLTHWPVIVGPLTAAIGVAVLVFGIVNLVSG